MILPGKTPDWASRHPDGYVVTYFRYGSLPRGITPLYQQPYRSSRILALFSSEQINADPEAFANAGR